MNIDEAFKLSVYELRFKVAELLGWRMIRMDEATRLGLYKPAPSTDQSAWILQFSPENKNISGQAIADWNGKLALWKVPDWPNDLNACYEMEEALKQRVDGQMLRVMPRRYPRVLAAVVKRDHGSKAEAGIPTPGIYRATARQRCVAFVITKTRGRHE